MNGDLAAILSYKPAVDKKILSYLDEKKAALSRVNKWGSTVIDRLKPFVVAGKTLRGSLVVYTYSLFQKKIGSMVYDAATAMELFQTGLIIHDDIMDGDEVRRGLVAIHKQVGEDVAMCVGDLCFFLGYELLPSSVHSLVSKELQSVAVAQMQDVSKTNLTDDERMRLYRYKTARYTFSLPMMVGAALSDKPASPFEKLGESLGLLYQIRDDELDNEKSPLGKQKTLFLTQSERQITMLPIDKKGKAELTTLVNFCITREK